MQKLHLALDVYRGLGNVSTTRADTITKVTSMLLHPFPKVRHAFTDDTEDVSADEMVDSHYGCGDFVGLD
jgi:hypothetical protein